MSRHFACANGSVLLDRQRDSFYEGFVNAARCGSYGCSDCGPRKAKRLRIRLMKRLSEVLEQEALWLGTNGLDPSLAWRPFKLITLSMDVKRHISAERYAAKDWTALPHEVAAARQELMRAWNRLHSWLAWTWRSQQQPPRRAAWEGDGKSVPYLWVIEFTQQGWPHLHVLLLWRSHISLADLWKIRRLWQKYGIGKSVDLSNRNWIGKRRSDAVSGAADGPNPLGLAAYLTKGLTANGHLSHSRRWSASKSFFPPRPRKRWEGQAAYSTIGIDFHRRERSAAGASIKDTDAGFAWSVSL